MKYQQRPLRLSPSQKRDVRTQFGALCWRERKGQVQVLLVTSRRTGRWVLPKGWPIDGKTPAEAATFEAWEEAGARGKSAELCVGVYAYVKDDGEEPLPCMVAVFPVRVKRTMTDWPEKGQRTRRWFSLKKAAAAVEEPELGSILLNFKPGIVTA